MGRQTTIGVLIFLVFIQLVTALIVPHLIDLQESDAVAPDTITMDQNEQPSAWDAISWIWNSIEFAFDMTTFQIADMPEFVNTIWVLMNVMTVICIIFLARGL